MRLLLFIFGILFFVAACSNPDERQAVFGSKDELLAQELGDAKVLATKMWNGNTLYFYIRNQETTHEEVAVGTIKKVDRGYAWISSPSFRIDTSVRFDFDLQDGDEAVNVYIGRVSQENVRQVSIRDTSESLDVYDGYFIGFELPEYVEVEMR